MKITFDESLNNYEELVFSEQGLKTKHTFHAGTSAWVKDAQGKIVIIRFVCPCGCSDVCSVPIDPSFDKQAWNFNGNYVQPTLTPSILRLSGCKWHGFLTNGEWITC